MKPFKNNDARMVNQVSPLVSVLMTVYNREAYIAEAIESVLASTYTNFELIIVDDRSSDKSYEIAQRYAEQDERIRLYQNAHNLGDYPNRNQAAAYAQGKYIKYLDADDLIYWYGLEVMVKSMETFPNAAVGLSHSKPEEQKPYPYQVTPEEAYREHFLGRGLFNYGPTGLIIKRSVFEKEGGFSKKRFLGDAEFLLRIGAKYATVKMAPGLTWYRRHEAQEIKIGKESGYYLINTFSLNLEKLHSTYCPLPELVKYLAISRQKQHHARKILALTIKQKRPLLAYQAYKKAQLSLFDLLKGFLPYK